MPATAEIYDQFQQLISSGKPHEALEGLIAHLTESERFHELFEARKMQLRLSLGLSPAQADQEEKCDDATELKLEQGLLAICSEVGERFFKAGKIREGWMYMRPVGDRQQARSALEQVEANDENLDELLEVLVHETVDVRRGYALALERLGTCNSITLFESALAARPRADQQAAAELLVKHVHRELLENIRGDIERREGKPPEESTIAAILESRTDLLEGGAYHLDTSHLASTVRFARVLDDCESIRLALDIAKYGRRLHRQYQYPGEEPFLDLYPASIAFFEALLGENTDAAIRYFKHKSESVSQQDFGYVAIEVLIDLLSRCGRHEEALQVYAARLPVDARIMGIAPTLLQLSKRLGDYEAMQSICQKRDDLLGYAAALLSSKG